MGKTGPDSTAYLTLDELKTDPDLARRLPSDLAWRCHALPLAEDQGRVTVAMADPDDTRARAAVVAALGPESCVVKGSALAIDTRLAEIWGTQTRRLGLRVCAYPDDLSGELWDYAQSLGTLLDAHTGCCTATEMSALARKRGQVDCDLVILNKCCPPLFRHLLSHSVTDGDLSVQPGAVPFGILVAERPRWPIQRILLVISGVDADSGAVDWVVRLARPSSASITVLAVVPPVPEMYRGLSRMEQSVAAVLDTDTALGRQMHQVARRLAECEIDGTLRLRQGAPDQRIHQEVIEGDHDLIVMATQPCRWWLRQLKGDPVCTLLERIHRPVLLAEASSQKVGGSEGAGGQ